MMTIEGLVLQFQGLDPHPEEQHEIEQRLEQLMDQAPSECALQASFLKKGPLIRGVLCIHTANGTELKAVVAGTSFASVANRLFGKMALKIHEWKRKRLLMPEESIYENSVVSGGAIASAAHH